MWLWPKQDSNSWTILFLWMMVTTFFGVFLPKHYEKLRKLFYADPCLHFSQPLKARIHHTCLWSNFSRFKTVGITNKFKNSLDLVIEQKMPKNMNFQRKISYFSNCCQFNVNTYAQTDFSHLLNLLNGLKSNFSYISS